MDEIRTVEDIQQLVRDGFSDWQHYGAVTVRQTGELLIFNYGVIAQFEARWNPFEQLSRGLIIHRDTGEIVARAFDKFFNWMEGGRHSTGDIVHAMEKLDGSLGILYRVPDGYRIATRGSIGSKQATWATRFLNANYDLHGLAPELTLLFEIIYPANRVVVDYGRQEALVLLGVRNRFTGNYLPFVPDVIEIGNRYGFPCAKTFHFDDVDTLIHHTLMLDANHEGYVVEFSDGSRFKFKGQRYLELHRIRSTLTFSNVLSAMAGSTINEFLSGVPDEFLNDTKRWMREIQQVIDETMQEVTTVFATLPTDTRKDFAIHVTQHHQRIAPYLFRMLDGHPVEPLIYKRHRWTIEDGEETETE